MKSIIALLVSTPLLLPTPALALGLHERLPDFTYLPKPKLSSGDYKCVATGLMAIYATIFYGPPAGLAGISATKSMCDGV